MKIVMTVPIMLKKPSGFLPIAMSLAAIAIVLVHLVVFGITHELDEGAAAHVWRLLMAGQVPIVVFFIIHGLPQAPRPALQVLALQVAAALAAVVLVWMLRL
jgi:hypothetical protein